MPVIINLPNKLQMLCKQNWLQFLFIVKACALKQRTSEFYMQFLSADVCLYIYGRLLTGIHVAAGSVATTETEATTLQGV